MCFLRHGRPPVHTLSTVSRGLGTTQRAILALLAEHGCATVEELATAVKRSPQQVRTAVAALERREQVVVLHRQHVGWKGRGEYGRLVRKHWRDDDAVPTELVVEKGQPWPFREGYFARERIELCREGVPVVGLLIWSADAYAARLSPGPSD